MDSAKLPPMDDPLWKEALVADIERSAKDAIALETARHGKSAAPASAITTGLMCGRAIAAIHKLAKQVAEIHKAAAADAEALNQTVATLADAMKQIQGKGLQFMGRWSRNVDYTRGDIVSHNGALWVATDATLDTPGVGMNWQRMLKSDNRGMFVVGDDRD